MNQKSLSDAVSLFQINKSAFVSVAKLKQLLSTVELAIFFGKFLWVCLPLAVVSHKQPV